MYIFVIIITLISLKVLVIKGGEPTDDSLPVTVVSILLICLVFGTAFFLICEYINLIINLSVARSTSIKSVLNDCSLFREEKKKKSGFFRSVSERNMTYISSQI